MKEKIQGLSNKGGVLGWLFNIPYLVYSLIYFLIPLGWAIWLSATDWNLMSINKNFVGIDNFIRLFSDSKIKAVFFNSFKYLVPIVVLSFIVAMIIALLVYNLPDKIKGFTAVLFFIPYLTSGVAVSVVVRYFFSYNSALSIFLRDNGINIDWFRDSGWAFAIIIGIIVWKMSGYYALFILSALESIPDDVYDACKIDGVYGFKKFTCVILPMILPTLTTVLVLASGLAFGIFTEPYLLTGGGPNLATTTWQLEIYNTSFTNFQSGYGAAIAIANAVHIFITIKILNVVMDKINAKYGA
ncbi:sugar ABC transporter permease [Clostridioides sp. ES-S-0108-01]|uniref:carbohydrate ABC transporter permease n=1 Tax=Clostridioides sp. ES-S-0108-01 TaxID=2770773 RepID=UPI001D0C9761|nr:sugar ABC transporter permease [Clostridioides sp. ES-S-0108-01]UDN50173.1 sugar ABC transporter permease [Clostridioides sp. ES-S-0107-01]